MVKSSGIQNPCDCGFDESGLEFCENGIIHSDIFRRIIETECNCICHGSVIPLHPVTPIKPVCPQCGMSGQHKLQCTQEYWDGIKERELVAA